MSDKDATVRLIENLTKTVDRTENHMALMAEAVTKLTTQFEYFTNEKDRLEKSIMSQGQDIKQLRQEINDNKSEIKRLNAVSITKWSNLAAMGVVALLLFKEFFAKVFH